MTQTQVDYLAKKNNVKKVVLLYSGGLDTSCMLKWIQDEYKAQVIALTVDIGQQADDLEKIKNKALKLGAVKAYVIDAKDDFADHYISKGIKANGKYQGNYYLSTPLGRPLLAKIAVKIAQKEQADAIAHGCTGKGNDQVRIEAGILTLNPKMKIIAPVREWQLGREEEIKYAKKHNIEISQSIDCPYSYDDNMWGVTGEGGEIEDPKLTPNLEKIVQTTTLPEKAPNNPEFVELKFEKGIPIALNNKEMKLSNLIFALNNIGAKHGIGLCILIEDRFVGIKIRGVYEHPAAHIIIEAHKNLEKLVSTQEENTFKELIDQKWSHLCYCAKWFEPLMNNLNAFIDKMNEKVSGIVKIKLYKGNATVLGINSPYSLFDENLATFMKSGFNQNASPGFIEIYSLAMRTASQVKLKNQ